MAEVFPPEGNGGDRPTLLERAPFSQLDPKTRQQLRRICHVQGVLAGQSIMATGEKTDFVGFVQSGILRIHKVLQDDHRHIVGLLMEGDMFGRVFDGPMPFGVEAAIDSRIICFQREAFERLILQSPDLDQLIVLEFLNEIDRARDWMIVLGNPKIRGKVAGFLIMLCTRFRRIQGLVTECGGSLSLRIPIGRKDIANLLGTRPESISRALHALQDDGILEIVQPDLITVRSPLRLSDEAGGAVPVDFAGFSQLPDRWSRG